MARHPKTTLWMLIKVVLKKPVCSRKESGERTLPSLRLESSSAQNGKTPRRPSTRFAKFVPEKRKCLFIGQLDAQAVSHGVIDHRPAKSF